MRFFTPNLKLGVLLPRQDQLEDKFGGLPWGLPPKYWPICRGCGQSQSLLAELIHNPERLDLGGEGRVLFVFHCMAAEECRYYEGGSGANAVLLINQEEMTDAPTPLPAKTKLYTEVRVQTWDALEAEEIPETTLLGGERLWFQTEEWPKGAG